MHESNVTINIMFMMLNEARFKATAASAAYRSSLVETSRLKHMNAKTTNKTSPTSQTWSESKELEIVALVEYNIALLRFEYEFANARYSEFVADKTIIESESDACKCEMDKVSIVYREYEKYCEQFAIYLD